jgi:hypothetical protein
MADRSRSLSLPPQLTICVRAFGACLQKRRESCLWRAIQINLCWLAAYQ